MSRFLKNNCAVKEAQRAVTGFEPVERLDLGSVCNSPVFSSTTTKAVHVGVKEDAQTMRWDEDLIVKPLCPIHQFSFLDPYPNAEFRQAHDLKYAQLIEFAWR